MIPVPPEFKVQWGAIHEQQQCGVPGVPRGKGRVMGNPWGSLDASSQEARLVGSQEIGLCGFGF